MCETTIQLRISLTHALDSSLVIDMTESHNFSNLGDADAFLKLVENCSVGDVFHWIDTGIGFVRVALQLWVTH